jgi:outer membrane protein assembly factor BamB
MRIEKDLAFGLDKEDELLATIKKLDNTLERAESNVAIFDYVGETCYVELKSRRVNKSLYYDTMVGKNKIDYAMTCDKPVYFCFNFTDGTYYWKFNQADIDNKKVSFRDGGRWDRGKSEIKPYAFIDTDILIPF